MILLISTIGVSQNEFRIPSDEHFIGRVSTFYYPTETSTHNKGLDLQMEAGYQGFVYSILGFETFSAMKSEGVTHGRTLNGMTTFHAVVGFNFTSGMYEEFDYHFGLRLVRVYRGAISENYWRTHFGFEFGFNFDLTDDFSLGAKGTIDKKRDKEIFDLRPTNEFKAFLTLTYKLKRLGA